MINRFNIDMVKMENLSSLSPRGKKGYFARIIADMIKQLGTEIERGSIIWRLNQWCEKEHPNLQYIKRNPRNTSKIHFWCEGDGRVIRGDDWEFGTCSKCDEINIDTHLNACYNIANWGMRPPPKDLVSPS